MGAGAVGRGRAGEELAARYLAERGWRVIGRNWRDGPRELDLVVRRERVLAFVEVKTRTGPGWGHPLESLTWRKRREVERAARAWLSEWYREAARAPEVGAVRPDVIRFDAVSVRIPAHGEPVVEHVPDAWRPGWGRS